MSHTDIATDCTMVVWQAQKRDMICLSNFELQLDGTETLNMKTTQLTLDNTVTRLN